LSNKEPSPVLLTKNKQKNSAIPKTNNFFIVPFVVLKFIKDFRLLALNMTGGGSLTQNQRLIKWIKELSSVIYDYLYLFVIFLS